ncbi:MAG: FtsW/RodA/SpoVE family cell cycle protein [Oscillospiraceae bacterium]|jgi:cell division protein FtsW (lipid II flippase)|nr:FtsW/RodA/SpoVE family cell cycle protein [Oscillospiraceae bacterium]
MQQIMDMATVALRIIMPLYALIIVYQCFASMRRSRRPKTPLVSLCSKIGGQDIPVLFWENTIGRAKGSDIYLPDPAVSRDHCVLLRRAEGWFITDTGSKSGTYINGKKVKGRTNVYIGDDITLGGQTFKFSRGDAFDGELPFSWYFKESKDKPYISPGKLLLLVNVFHFMMAVAASFSFDVQDYMPMAIFAAVTVLGWLFFGISAKLLHRHNFELETLGLFFSGIGITLLVRQAFNMAVNQLAACVIGIVFFMIVLRFIKNPDIVSKWRLPIMIAAGVLLAVNLALGASRFGQSNWVYIGPISVQPSEFIKVAYIFVGAATLDELQTKHNFITFLAFTGVCIGSLAIMGDYGTSLIFFTMFMIVAFMRSGHVRTIILSCAGAVGGLAVILSFRAYALDRFKAWGHVWEYAQSDTYQQSRVLTYTASGGLFGVGIGNGVLKGLGASESDLVFGILAEEMGIIMAIVTVVAICALLFYSRAVTTRSRSTFYSIAANCAAGLLVIQMSLNIFGATDILPLTGVTLPFISMGGSSLISVWGLLAFIKAADERTFYS